VPAPGHDFFVTLTRPLGYVVGTIRTISVLFLVLVYLVLVQGVCLILVSTFTRSVNACSLMATQTPVSPLYRIVARIFTSVIARLILLLVGVVRLPVEHVSRKRGHVERLVSLFQLRLNQMYAEEDLNILKYGIHGLEMSSYPIGSRG
jgi:hypothetical protein